MSLSVAAACVADTPIAAITPYAPASAGKLAEFRSVTKAFRQASGQTAAAICEVTLDIRQGEILTILGPSGCGKSTLLNMLAGIFAPTSGEVLYRGRPVRQLNPATGYMTQSDHLLPWRTIAANVRAPLEIRRADRAVASARVEELLDLVGLTGAANAYPSQVSGGMRKRAALARLLAYDPETLLLDEPFVALDAQLRLSMQAELRAVCRRLGKTMLFVTHDVDEAVSLGDRCLVFEGRPGRIRELAAIDLPPDRDLVSLRRSPAFVTLSARFWEMMVATPAQGSGRDA